MIEEYKETHDFFNDNLKAIYKDLKEVTEQTNVKLYDLAYSIDDSKQEEFNFFCELSFQDFKEMLEEKNVKIESIGRSSSFYLISESHLSCYHNLLDNFYLNNDYETFLIELVNFIDLPISFEYATFNDFLVSINDNEEDFSEELEVENSFFEREKTNIINDLKEELKNIKFSYEWLETFKENSINYFKDFSVSSFKKKE